MINGMTPDEYSGLVAQFCEDSLSIRSLLSRSDIRPLTQIVYCTYDRNPDDLSMGRLNFIKNYTRDSCRSDEYRRFAVAIKDGQTIGDAVYLALSSNSTVQTYDKNYDLTIGGVFQQPVFNFITTIHCRKYEDPDTVKLAYLARIKSKYQIDLPAALVMVDASNVETDIRTTMKFVNHSDSIPLNEIDLIRNMKMWEVINP